MSYTNGLNNLQHFISTAVTSTPSEAKNANTGVETAAKINGVVASDKARLSTASSLVSLAISGSDVRSEKIAPLQAAIAAGTYHVSSSDVANKVIHSLLN